MKTLSVLKALADGNRLRIMMAIMKKGELCACQIIELLGVSGATSSRHLGILQAAGLLQSRKESRWVYYRMSDQYTNDTGILKWLEEELASDTSTKADDQALESILAIEPEEICRKQRGEKCCP